MSFKPLIEKQTIRIDAHLRGTAENVHWDDTSKDIHLDKTTNTKVNGKRQNVRIRAPLNSDHSIIIENLSGQEDEIPRSMRKEIQEAFKDKQKRGVFIRELFEILGTYSNFPVTKEAAIIIMERLAKHFDIKWTGKEISTYLNDALVYYSQLHSDDTGRLYFITLATDYIEIGQLSGNVRRRRSLPIYWNPF